MSHSDYAIRIKGIGKQYRLGQEQSAGMYKYKSLGDTVATAVRSPLKTLRSTVLQPPLDESNSFWALKDVSFDVKRGEVVGIIGRNGAGKSTLLKILSRITRPTTGEIELHGRVGSLLEVGTGFHPELSGRENIYLNGAVLGMTRGEVRKKFDEIVSFSEIEKFLDTPVKQYSSGMYTRLAFAVAAHLDPEILVVDEVLAVGDAAFQRKCLGKMKDVAQCGRTVLFVSHNLDSQRLISSSGVLLDGGHLVRRSHIAEVLSEYLSPSGSAAINANHLSGLTASIHPTSAPCGAAMAFDFILKSSVAECRIRFNVYDWDGRPLLGFLSPLVHISPSDTLRCSVPLLPLLPGIYRINANVEYADGRNERFQDAVVFSVAQTDLSTQQAKTGNDQIRAFAPHTWLLFRDDSETTCGQ